MPPSAATDGASGGWRSLERGDHGLLSQGAKIVTLQQPFLAVGAALDAVELPLYTTCGVPEVCLPRELQRFGRASGGP